MTAVNRRVFLRRTAAAGSGVLLCGCGLFRTAAAAAGLQPRSGSARRQVVVAGKRIRAIDMHSHGYVHDIWPLIKDRKELVAPPAAFIDLAKGPMALDGATMDARLREMDRQGIDLHVMSVHPQQYHYWAEPELAAQIVKIQNEKIAEICAARPDRFVALGAAAIQHPGLAIEQMEYAVEKLNMHGVIIGGSVNGEEISNPKLDNFWKKSQELGIIVFVHPATFEQGAKRFAGSGYLTNSIGMPAETTVALSHMIFDGFLDRFPDVRILAAHGGGFLPSYIGRSDNCHSARADCQTMKRKPSDYLRGPQLYFDALVYTPENIRHLVATVGASQIVVGTDFAFDIASREPVDAVLQTPGLSPDDQIAILSGNAAKLLKLGAS